MKKGFTLVELLIVIAIVAVLATAVTLVLNPAELLRQARDTTRLSDISTIDSAIGLYIADVTSPSWSSTSTCTVTTSSLPFNGGAGPSCQGNSSTSIAGGGWVNVDFSSISSGSPLPKLPLDPVNSGNYFYAFRKSTSTGVYELNANMESTKYSTGGGSDKESNTADGGDNNGWFEEGKSLNL